MQLRPLALHIERVVYNILFATAAETLRTIATDPKHLGVEFGFLAGARYLKHDRLLALEHLVIGL
jgi:hypothetical protein